MRQLGLLPAVVVLAALASGTARRCATEYAVKVRGGDEVAGTMANECGCTVLGKVVGFYHFCCSQLPTTLEGGSCMTRMSRHESVLSVEPQTLRARTLRSYVPPSDPSWPMQWSLENDGSLGNDFLPGRDLNVERAWIQGYTGCGVTVAVVDNGVDYTHPDLLPNYNFSLQYDYLDDDPDPFPMFETHGTQSTGIVGMAKNDICGVGVAYHSTITGIRLIGTFSVDMSDARALGHSSADVHIYSNSWGPPDNGAAVEGPGPITQQVLETAAAEGRDGKGNIYIFASGNGGSSDHCSADGFINSIYTIGVGAASANGEQAVFDEECSSKHAVAFVTSSIGVSVSSTLPSADCGSGFSGTSAAAPQVSGAVALALEANPDLTWRDVQYLIALTCNASVLVDGGWAVNGAGLMVSHKFGFGAVDAEALVIRARNWATVPPQRQSTLSFTPSVFGAATSSAPFVLSFTYNDSAIRSLEHVVVFVDLETVGQAARGETQIVLMSPSGTYSVLLGYRINDDVPGNYSNWPFMSVHFWGEDPTGEWSLTVRYRAPSGVSQDSLVDVRNISVVLYGTTERVLEDLVCTQCDTCGGLRDADSLSCSDDSECTTGFTETNGYCYNATIPEPLCLREPLLASCLSAGYSSCCVDEDCEANGQGCYCDAGCYDRGECCSDIRVVCARGLSFCADAGYTGCCEDIGGCFLSSGMCYCDQVCHDNNDCCPDIIQVGCFPEGGGGVGSSNGTDPVIPELVVGFIDSTYTVSESSGAVELQVGVLNVEELENVITLSVSTGTAGDTATASEDYIPLIDHPIQLTPERQSTTVTVDILDDSVFEGLEAETFTVRLQFVFIDPPPTDLEALLPNVNVSVNQATVFIIDNDTIPNGTEAPTVDPTTCAGAGFSGCCFVSCFVDGGQCFCDDACYQFGDCCHDIADNGCFPQNVVVGFVSSSYSVNENSGGVQLQVETQTPQVLVADYFITLSVTTGAATDNATADEDYVPSNSQTIQLNSQEQLATVTVGVVVDSTVEGLEFFTVQLQFEESNLPNVAFSVEPNEATVHISDLDAEQPVNGSTGATGAPPVACAEAGISGCCNSTVSQCFIPGGSGCYCDLACHSSGDCCSDIFEVGCFPVSTYTIVFEETNVQVEENSVSVLLSVALVGNGSLSQPVQIGVVTATLFERNAASELEDYEPVNDVLTFSEQNLTQLVTIQINDDSLYESSESFSVRIFNINEQQVAISQDTATVTIIDDDRVEFGFEPLMYVVGENQQRVEVSARVISGTLGTSITASVIFTDGTTTGGIDYVLPNLTRITFEPNEAAADPLVVTVINDDTPEDNERLFLFMTVSGLDNPNFTIRPDQAVISITDDDDVVIGFEQVRYLVSESANAVVITVSVLEGTLREELTVVSLVTVDLEATAERDYVPTSTQLPFNNLSTSFQVDIPIIQDSVSDEGDELFLVELALVSSQGFVQLAPSEAVVVIQESLGGQECGTGGVRLLGGAGRSNEGRVEVCVDGAWSSVCQNTWDYREAIVVCRQLGLPYSGAVALPGGAFGSGNTSSSLTDVECDSREVTLLQCRHSRVGGGVCIADAGVLCRGGVEDCRCRRSIECSIDGNFISEANVDIVGRTLTCTINFEDDILEQKSTQIDMFEVEFLSHGSAILLKELGAISTGEEEFRNCEVDISLAGIGNPSVVLQELGVEQLQLLYLNEEGSFDNLFLNLQQLEYVFLAEDYSFNGRLDERNACAFQHLAHWLSTSSRLPTSRCRQPSPSLPTILTFDVFC